MSACEFEFVLPVEAPALHRALETDFARFGGSLDGGASGGRFTLPTPLGEFTGTYSVQAADSGCRVRIELDEKPMFVPCSTIENHLERRLHRAATG